MISSKEEIEAMKKYFSECITKEHVFEEDLTIDFMKISKSYIEQLEANLYESNNIINDYIEDRQKLIKYLEEKIKLVNNGAILSIRSEFKKILEILKGEKNE